MDTTGAMFARPSQIRKRTDDEDDAIMRDGEVWRIGMMMRDSLTPVQQAIMDKQNSLITGVRHSPGYVFDCRTPQQKQSVEDAYRAAELRDANAWRGDKPKAEAPELDAQHQAAAESLWRANAASFVSSMRPPPDDLSAAYAESDAADSNAWKKGKF